MKLQFTPCPERPRLLIVDHQPLTVQVLFQLFGLDCEVLAATGGVQALDIARRVLPNLILLDVEMPDLDGFEVCRRLKSDDTTCDIPVLFVTGRNSVEEETRGLEAGAVDFICKPIHAAVVVARVKTHLKLKWQSDQLRNMAFLDELTGVANRRYFDQALAKEWRVCARAKEVLSFAFIDVDYFKSYNDRYGHPAGDACLTVVATRVAKSLRRPRDFVARYGGEEFVCLLPATDLRGARVAVEAIRAAVEAAAIQHASSGCGPVVTVSVGATTARPSHAMDPSSLVVTADQNLYKAKLLGRNRTICE